MPSHVIPVYEYHITITSDTIDVNGHVNNVHYISWMQEAAIAHSKANGLEYHDYAAMQRAWLVRAHSITYKRPILEDDDIRIQTWLYRFNKHDALRKYLFLNGSKVVAQAETTWVLVDTDNGRPALISPEIRQAFLEIDKE